MSKAGKKLIHPPQNEYGDRRTIENENFPDLTVRLEHIESLLLLLDSEEELVLISILKHLTDYVRKDDNNISLLKEHHVLELLMRKGFYRSSPNAIIRRFSLYLIANIVETMNTLVDLETNETMEIVRLSLEYFVEEEDEFCQEFLSVVINKCLDDPQMANNVLQLRAYVEKFFYVTTKSYNPDVIFHSLELLEKLLRVLSSEDLLEFIAQSSFPVCRVLCELSSEFVEIRRAALKVVHILVLVISENNPLYKERRKVQVMEQLTKMFCQNLTDLESDLVVDVLASAMRNEPLAHIFFEHNFFELLIEHFEHMEYEGLCKSLSILCEAANYGKFLPRLSEAGVTEILLRCFLDNDGAPSTHILMGLNRLIKHADACKRIVESFDRGIIKILLDLVNNIGVNIKAREHSVDLLLSLLKYAYHRTAVEMMDLEVSNILATAFGQDSQYLSPDLILTLVDIVESISANVEYREQLCENSLMTKNLGMLLMNSFSTAIVVSSIFRCLCSLVDEEDVRRELLQCYISSSIKRALKSLSTLVKTSVTNFIMQTSRFPEFVSEYIDNGVLEVLIMHQNYSLGVPTWTAAIDVILSKNPTMKFCVRNSLGFTDLTSGHDFFVSKKKFEDFRVFQTILKADASPLRPIFVVNFERSIAPEESVVRIPVKNCQDPSKLEEWCYCRTPGDPLLPQYLNEVVIKMKDDGLTSNPIRQRNSIDFENIAKRAKIIAQMVAQVLSKDLAILDLTAAEECSQRTVECHLKELAKELHCTFIPLGLIRSGCQFERAVLFKCLADQVGLPCTLERSVDGRILFNEVPLPFELQRDVHCDPQTLRFMPWRMLRPTHVVDLIYNVGELYPMQSRQALQYLRLN